MDTIWSDEQKANWHRIQREYCMNEEEQLACKTLVDQRIPIQKEMTYILKSFLERKISVEEFNSIFQQKMNRSWNVFGFRGMSGGMFLNKLLKYIPDANLLGYQLRKALPVPKNVRQAYNQMSTFQAFLEDLIDHQEITKSQLQPSRIPFFLSAWWHLQNVEQWPVYYPSIHAALMSQGTLRQISQDVIKDYFTFRIRFLRLMKELDLSCWSLEHLLTWYSRTYLEKKYTENHPQVRSKRHHSAISKRNGAVVSVKPINPFPTTTRTHNVRTSVQRDEREEIQGEQNNLHTHLQWLLAKIGWKVGCQVWIAGNDHQKEWNGEPLHSLSLPSFPDLTSSGTQKILSKIDVVWFQDEMVIAAYEIVRTTDVPIGLLRLYDLGALLREQEIYLCIVVPKDRLKKVQTELERPLFTSQHLPRPCSVICEETLLKDEEHILRWATSPSVTEMFCCADVHNTDGVCNSLE